MHFALFLISILLVIDAIGTFKSLQECTWTFVEEVFQWLFIAAKCVSAVLIWL